MKKTYLLILCLLALSTSRAQTDPQASNSKLEKKLPGTYAYTGLEKICLKLQSGGSFDLFTSTCFEDQSHVGQYTLNGDTLTLNSAVKPSMKIDSSGYEPNPDGVYTLRISSSEPLLLRSAFVTVNGKKHQLDASGKIPPQARAFDKIIISLEGFAPIVHPMPELPATKVHLNISFRDLHTPYLQNERWRIDGKKLHYLPAPGSEKREDIYVKKGKKCFYR